MKVVASAPAKVILFGEHAVVYGEPAIATAINVRTRAYVEESDELYIEAYSLYGRVEDLRPIERMLREAMKRFSISGLKVIIESSAPMSAGLGSSASAAVAVAACVSKIAKGELDLDLTISLADIAEEVAHGKPSGIDTRISAYGGTMLYVKGEKPKFTNNLSGEILIGFTGIPRSTRELVLGVKRRFDKHPSIRMAVRAIGELVRSIRKRLEEPRSIAEFSEEARINHGLLRALGVSHPVLDRLVRAARMLDVGAKLTGAGGGGSAIAFSRLVKAERDNILSEFERSGTLLAHVGAPGVRIEG